MLTQFEDYLTFENIYIFSNYGILPFWILLITIPESKFTKFFINSIVLPLILSTAYIYVLYQSILLDEKFLDIFKLYFGMDSLYTIFATESFLLIFWIHFLALSLFLGSWVSRDAIKYNMPKKIVIFPLIIIFFTGPLGLVLYWFFRIFYSKKLSLHD